MNAVSSSTNPGMTDLIQLLSSSGSPLANSGLSSTQLQSVLQDASPGDLVQLSDQALQLQTVTALFGGTDTSQTSSSDTLESLVASLSAGSTDSSTATPSLADQATTYQAQLQAEETQALFGTNTSTNTSGSLLNVLG